MNLVDLKYLKIELRSKPFKHIVTTWVGHSSKDDFLKGISTILDIVVKHDARRILNDVRMQQVVGIDAQNEAAQMIKAFVPEHGLFKQAMLVPQDVFLKFGTKNFDNKIKQGVKDEINQFFDSEESALEWLQQQAV